jgi:general L-amino acid transport system permease protein
VPLLLWLLMVYFGVMLRLPPPGESVLLLGGMLNQRGLYLPELAGAGSFVAAIGLAGLGVWAGVRLQRFNGMRRVSWTAGDWALLALLLVPALGAWMLAWRMPVTWPAMGRFNVEGGVVILPELMALVIGLVTYTGAYIGEIVRAGIQSVGKGQRQAAAALGLGDADTLRLIVIPQGLRAIIPPLTNQYVNLAKNSSLAVAIGYPDLVSVFAGTILNHTNQAVETIAITMAVYLVMSLVISGVMGVFNARVALVER